MVLEGVTQWMSGKMNIGPKRAKGSIVIGIRTMF